MIVFQWDSGTSGGRILGLLLSCALVWGGCGGWAFGGDGQPAPKAGRSDLDRELLDDLPPARPKPAVRPGTPAESNTRPGRTTEPSPGRTSEAGRDEGEDIDLVGPEEFLRDIRLRMKAVEQRLRDRDWSRSTQAEQGKIAAELASFIKQLQRQQDGDEGDKTGGSGQASDKSGGGSPQPSRGPVVESSDTNQQQPAAGDSAAALEAALTGVWGNLSPQLRQQIQSLTHERFLPQYERLIQQYYRRLAELPQQ